MSGTGAPSSSVVLMDEAMLHDPLLNFAITNPLMATITCPLPAAMMTIDVEVSVTRLTTALSHLHLTTESLHSTTVVHHHPLILMTVVYLWMIVQLDDPPGLTLGRSHQAPRTVFVQSLILCHSPGQLQRTKGALVHPRSPLKTVLGLTYH